jgi:hypothetical protein
MSQAMDSSIWASIQRVAEPAGAGAIKCGSFSLDVLGNWYFNVSVAISPAWLCADKQVGIDFGLKTTATMSDGTKYDGLRAYSAVEAGLCKAQRVRKKKQMQALRA